MDLIKSHILAHELLNHYGYDKVVVKLMKRKNIIGQAATKNGAPYQLLLNREFVELNTEEFVKNVILHEIAHFMAGVHNNHNHIWKQKCLEIGAIPEAIARERTHIRPASKYIYECVACKAEYGRERLIKNISRYSCKCKNPIRLK